MSDNGYSGNSYFPGGSQASGGGGFTATTPGSQGTPGFTKKSNAPPVRPVTIRMINGAKQMHGDADLLIDDAAIASITIVGKVLKIDRTDTNIRYLLEDSTDQIEARYWLDSNQSSLTENDDIAEDMYVRAIGSLKTFHTKRQFNAATVRPVTDYHEVAGHCMDVIASHLLYKKGPPPVAGAAPSGSNLGSYSASAASATQVASSQRFGGLPPTQRAICEFLLGHPNHGSGGAEIKVIVRGIAHVTDATSGDIAAALDVLMEQGVIFQTKSDTEYDIIA